MKACNYCLAQIPDEAIRCQYCTSWIEQSSDRGEASSRVVYILDRDLIRFGKFAIAVLGIMIVAGVYLFGIDLKDTGKEVRNISDDVKKQHDIIKSESDLVKSSALDIDKSKKEIDLLQKQIAEMKSEALAAANEAKEVVFDLTRNREQAHTIMEELSSNGWIKLEIQRQFDGVLPPEQFGKLIANIRNSAAQSVRSSNQKYTKNEVLKLVESDVRHAVEFFKKYGIDIDVPMMKIQEDDSYVNTYWDGTSIVFGMGMVNGDIFGPYSSSVTFHEAAHMLFSIGYAGQSGSVTESVCDVIAALIAGEWTIGSIRPKEVLRSLKAPGTAYNNPLLGVDQQPDRMSAFVKQGAENPHVNSGILNKAAYLISEGGEHGGVNVRSGLGKDKTSQLYMEVIKKLRRMKNQHVEFQMFRDIIITTGRETFANEADRRTVAESFRAVGL